MPNLFKAIILFGQFFMYIILFLLTLGLIIFCFKVMVVVFTLLEDIIRRF